MGARTRLALPPHIGQDIFDDGGAMAPALADRVAAMLRHALGARGTASLVVSGGRSPVAFFRALAQRELDWARVSVTLADERWLPPEHPDSNAGQVRATLLRGAPSAARFVPLFGGEESPEAGLAASARRLATIARPFDVVLLGMGEDGHFASLFPGVEGLAGMLAEAGPEVAAVHPPLAPHARLSLTLAALLDARRVLVQIHGARKRAVIEAAAAGADPAQHPIAALLQQTRSPLQVFFGLSE